MRPAPSVRTRAFVDALLAGFVLFGLAVRMRLQAGSPLPSDQPLRWLLLGAAGDVAVLGLSAALLLFLFRGPRGEAVARGLLAVLGASVSLLLVLWGEAILYFGHAPRRQDLEVAADRSFISNSFSPTLAAELLAVGLALGLVVAASVAWSRRARSAWSRPWSLAAAGAAGLALVLAPLRVHQAQTAQNPVGVLLSLRKEARAESRAAPADAAPRPEDVSVRRLVRAADARFLDDAYPLAMAPPPRSPSAPVFAGGGRPNVVFVVMEGVRSEEIGAYGGRSPASRPTSTGSRGRACASIGRTAPGRIRRKGSSLSGTASWRCRGPW